MYSRFCQDNKIYSIFPLSLFLLLFFNYSFPLLCLLCFTLNVDRKKKNHCSFKEKKLVQGRSQKKRKKANRPSRQSYSTDTFLCKSIFTAKTYEHSQTNSLSPSNSRAYHVILSRNIGQTQGGYKSNVITTIYYQN